MSLLVHNVYFALTDKSESAKQKLIAGCRKYLTGHAGTLHFSAGTCSDLSRPVNDRDYDVALHLVFASRADHDAYQVHERHQQFIAENRDNWAKVRVFDSDTQA